MLLVLNTSTLQFSIALVQSNGVVLGEYSATPASRHYGNMFPALDFLLKSVDLSMQDLSCIAVAIGPGSFTGLRVGISTALGFSYALGLPIIGVNALEGLASQVPCSNTSVVPIIDSRRDEVYLAKFTWSEKGRLLRQTEDLCLSYKDLPKRMDGPTIFVGSNFQKQREALETVLWPEAILAPPNLWNLRASAIGLLASNRYRLRDFDDPLNLSPIYLRPPDIRPNPYFKGSNQ